MKYTAKEVADRVRSLGEHPERHKRKLPKAVLAKRRVKAAPIASIDELITNFANRLRLDYSEGWKVEGFYWLTIPSAAIESSGATDSESLIECIKDRLKVEHKFTFIKLFRAPTKNSQPGTLALVVEVS